MFGQMLLRKPMFQGQNELDQLGKIFTVLGSPSKEDWPHVGELSNYVEFTETKAIGWTDLACFQSFPASTVDQLSKMLVMNPLKRITAAQALKHDYFSASPAPLTDTELSKTIVIEQTSYGKTIKIQPL